MEEYDRKFNAEIVDTFCFRWPAFRCYVLVRVLDTSIALFPVQSRRAFHYFHHAPLPYTPNASRPPLKHNELPIQDMFHSWKHTLALSDLKKEDDIENDDSNGHDDYAPPRERNSSVTLADVINECYPRLKHGWIHAPCTARPDTQTQTALILESPQNILLLKARSPEERQTFLNLVKLQSSTRSGGGGGGSNNDEDSSSCCRNKMSAHQLVQLYLNECRHIYDCLRRLAQKINQDEAKVRSYCELFEKLGSDWDMLESSVTSFVLSDDGSQEQLRETIEGQLRKTLDGYTHLSHRMHSLHERIQANPDAVGEVRMKLMLETMNCKPKWSWLLLLIGIIILCIVFGA